MATFEKHGSLSAGPKRGVARTATPSMTPPVQDERHGAGGRLGDFELQQHGTGPSWSWRMSNYAQQQSTCTIADVKQTWRMHR